MVNLRLNPAAVWAAAVTAVSCYLSYKLSPLITPHLCKDYERLNSNQKRDWDSRYVLGYGSTLHASAMTLFAAYFLLSEVLDETESGKGVLPIMLRTAPATEAALGMSLGYFVVDILLVSKHYPQLGGLPMLLHHVAALASLWFAVTTSEGHVYTLALLSTEVTTPFVNVRWMLDALKMRGCKAYTINGMLLLAIWFGARVVMPCFFFSHLYQHRDQLALLATTSKLLIFTVPPFLTVLNLWWFVKILRGALKLLVGNKAAAADKVEAPSQALLQQSAPAQSGTSVVGIVHKTVRRTTVRRTVRATGMATLPGGHAQNGLSSDIICHVDRPIAAY